MNPIRFAEANRELQKPEGMTDEQCASLPVYTNGQQCVSCWQATWKERIRFLFTGKAWLWVWSGETQPPVAVTVNDPFSRPDGVKQ